MCEYLFHFRPPLTPSIRFVTHIYHLKAITGICKNLNTLDGNYAFKSILIGHWKMLMKFKICQLYSNKECVSLLFVHKL